jgi:hypothetical protein
MSVVDPTLTELAPDTVIEVTVGAGGVGAVADDPPEHAASIAVASATRDSRTVAGRVMLSLG